MGLGEIHYILKRKIGDKMLGKREGNKKRIIIKLVILIILILTYFWRKYF